MQNLMFAPRMDRVLTLHVVRPLRTRISVTDGLPILMYHSISPERRTGHPYYETTTACPVFGEHLAFLHRQGYRSVTVSEAVAETETGGRPDKLVVITFDDGYLNFKTCAFPMLQEYGFSATMYLPAAYIGNSSRTFNGRPCLTWSDIRELQSAGVEFASHTFTHPQLRTLTPKAIHSELCQSKKEIEDNTGAPVRSFAYPYAFPEHDQSFRRMLKEKLQQCGYMNGVSTIIGRVRQGDDRYFLKRLPINSWDDLAFFQAKLEGSYDWLHFLQYAAKCVKSKVS